MPKDNRQTVYEEVTARIVRELEDGRVHWVQPWGDPKTPAAVGLPRNAATRRAYSGINILILWGAAIEHGRTGQLWLTFKQARAMGGSVRKGERGTTVVYANRFVPEQEKRRAETDGDDPRAVPFLKRYTVFNADQCDGLPAELTSVASPVPTRETIPAAEQLIRATAADFRIGGNRAFYLPSDDYVRVPPQPAFYEQIDYYRTCFHELGHYGAPRIMPKRIV